MADIVDQNDSRTEIRKELASMSFAEVLQLKEKLGSKVFNDAYHGRPLHQHRRANDDVLPGRSRCGRKGSQVPREESSKRRPPGVRAVCAAPRLVRRDPRFDGVSGSFSRQQWSEDYAFIEQMQSEEKTRLKKQLRRVRDPEEKQQLRDVIQRLDNRQRAEQERKENEDRREVDRQENIERLKEGKRPIFKSKKTLRQEQLLNKFNELKAKGSLDKHIQQQRKKKAGRAKKQVMGV